MQVVHDYKIDAQTVAGVAIAGKTLWTSLVSDGKGALARIDRTTGEVLSRVEMAIISGLTFDGEHLWGVTREGIHAFDPLTLAVVKTLPRPAYEGFLSGLAWDGEALWLGVYDERLLLKLDPKTGAVLKVVQSDRFVTGITWAGDELWHATGGDGEESTEIRHLDAASGAVLAKVDVPYAVSGMHHDGEFLWCGDCSLGRLRAVAPQLS